FFLCLHFLQPASCNLYPVPCLPEPCHPFLPLSFFVLLPLSFLRAFSPVHCTLCPLPFSLQPVPCNPHPALCLPPFLLCPATWDLNPGTRSLFFFPALIFFARQTMH